VGHASRGGEETNGAVYQACGGVTADAPSTVHVVRQAVNEGRHAYVLVNNRAEGNTPLTVQALSEMLRTSPSEA
jgi:hypothetical protein